MVGECNHEEKHKFSFQNLRKEQPESIHLSVRFLFYNLVKLQL